MAKVDTNEDWKKFLKVVTTSIEEHPDPSFIDTVAVCLNVSQNYRVHYLLMQRFETFGKFRIYKRLYHIIIFK